jgi:hypothetical protein
MELWKGHEEKQVAREKVGAWKKGWQNRPQRVRRMDGKLEVLDRKRLVTSCSLYIHIIFITEVFNQQLKMQNI